MLLYNITINNITLLCFNFQTKAIDTENVFFSVRQKAPPGGGGARPPSIKARGPRPRGLGAAFLRS